MGMSSGLIDKFEAAFDAIDADFDRDDIVVVAVLGQFEVMLMVTPHNDLNLDASQLIGRLGEVATDEAELLEHEVFYLFIHGTLRRSSRISADKLMI